MTQPFPRTTIVQQNIIQLKTPDITVITVCEADFTPKHLRWLFGKDDIGDLGNCVGIAGAYSEHNHLSVLALAVNSDPGDKPEFAHVLIIELSPEITDEVPKIRAGLKRNVLCRIRQQPNLYGFDLGPLSLLLHMHYDMHLTSGVDIQSALPITSRIPLASIQYALGGDIELNEDNISALFKEKGHNPRRPQDVAQRAWVSAYMGNLEVMQATRSPDAPKINTQILSQSHLALLEKLASDNHLITAMDPSTVFNDFSQTKWDPRKHRLNTQNSRFQTRMYNDSNSTVQVQTEYGTFATSAVSTKVKGRQATMKFQDNLSLGGKVVTAISSQSRSTPTYAQAKLAEDILLMLQRRRGFDNPWIDHIWDLPDKAPWPEDITLSATPSTSASPFGNPQYPINSSQNDAIISMLSTAPEDKIIIIQGPPGTGKTSVIATYVLSAIEAGQKGIWLMAQSNVAVKNIAEKLLDVGFEDWRLLVSADFHFDWHEHLYRKIQNKILPSDKWPKSPTAVKRELGSSQVILCTLSMISNPRLSDLGFTKVIPPISILIDEASQITVGDYFPMLNTFGKKIQNLSFIGDDKQLPPYGQEDIGDLQSIFEMPHLREKAKFLDIQYRMPPQIGDYISGEIYNGKLNSNPKHRVPKTTPSCFFIDIPEGKEQKDGTSWVNIKQAEAVASLAQILQEADVSFKIITPYDPQRNLLEKTLRDNGLSWENQCFNVDSFQGNEDDYIIISLVRSKEPGFLGNLRRTNVMLTRCKHGMFICTNKKFLIKGKGKDTLVGKMAVEWGEKGWVEIKDVEDGKVAV